MRSPYTKLTDEVMVEGRPTTILKEFEKGTAHPFRAFLRSNARSSFNRYRVMIWTSSGEPEAFDIAKADYDRLCRLTRDTRS